MKVNEIIQEGPMWDRIKSGASKIGTGILNAKAGYEQNKSLRQGKERIAKLAKDAEPYWIKTQAAYQQRGVTPDQLGQYLTQWARKWYNAPTIPDYSSVIGNQYSPIGIRKYLQTGASYYITPDVETTPPDSLQQPSTQPPQSQPQSAAPQPAQSVASNNTPVTNVSSYAMPVQTAQLPTAKNTIPRLVAPVTKNTAVVPATSNNSSMSNTGGTVTRTKTGVRHVSSPDNPNRIANAKPIR